MGFGEPRFIKEGEWGEYMRDNTIIQEELEMFALDYIYQMQNTKMNEIKIESFTYDNFEIQNGYLTGYEMLHGTSDNGQMGFSVLSGVGKFNKESGDYEFTFVLEWRDRINPNMGQGDQLPYDIATSINPDAKDYNITIQWTQIVKIKPTGGE